MIDSTASFPCTQCGLCCKKVGLAPETRNLDRGDGACQYYDESSKGCSIYDTRPDICRVDRQYEINYSKTYQWDEFVAINLDVCRALQFEEESKSINHNS